MSHILADYVGGYASYTINSDGSVETFVPAPFNTYNSDGTINSAGNSSDNLGLKRVKRYLPIAQGFMVEGSTGTTGLVSAKNAHRAYYKESDTNSEFFRNANISTQNDLPLDYKRFRLNIDFDDTYTRQLVQTFHHSATHGFDYGLESKMSGLLSRDGAWQQSNQNYVAQAEPFDLNASIPLRIVSSSNTSLRFRLFDIQNFDTDQDIFLYDAQNNVYYNLTDANANLTLQAGLYENRFYIRFLSQTLSLNENETWSNINVIYDSNNSQFIITNPNQSHIARAQLVDLTGKTIWINSIGLRDTQITIPSLHLSTGIYILNLHSEVGKRAFKVMVY